jgi:Leucine-rich repeat (LRR) protein
MTMQTNLKTAFFGPINKDIADGTPIIEMKFYKEKNLPKLKQKDTCEKIIKWINNDKELFEKKIIFLDFMNFYLTKFPVSLAFRYLKTLNLDNNRLKKIDVITENCFYLVEASFFTNKIEEIPRSIENLKDLEEALFGYNKIKNIPEELKNCTKLRIFHIEKNKLKGKIAFPPLKNLEDLDLSENKITDIKGLGELPKLKVLSLSGNKIEIIHPGIEKCKLLRKIFLDANKIKKIKLGSFENLRYLKKITITNQNLKNSNKLQIEGTLENLRYWLWITDENGKNIKANSKSIYISSQRFFLK